MLKVIAWLVAAVAVAAVVLAFRIFLGAVQLPCHRWPDDDPTGPDTWAEDGGRPARGAPP